MADFLWFSEVYVKLTAPNFVLPGQYSPVICGKQ